MIAVCPSDFLQRAIPAGCFEMYMPASFQMSDATEIHALMRKYSFATLITQGEVDPIV